MFQAISEYMGKPFWEQPLSMWDTVNNVGLRWKLNSKTVEMNWTCKKNPSSFVIVYCEFNCKCIIKDHTLCFWKVYVLHTNMVLKLNSSFVFCVSSTNLYTFIFIIVQKPLYVHSLCCKNDGSEKKWSDCEHIVCWRSGLSLQCGLRNRQGSGEPVLLTYPINV